MASAATAPVRQNERIQIIDTLRGIALLGILLMNIPYFSNPQQVAYNLNVFNEYSGPNYYTWWVVNGLFEGTMRGLFSMLFGAGCLLLLSRLSKKKLDETAADIYYRRLLWLLLFGFFNAFILLWPGDILYAYALTGLFLYPFRKMQPKYLLLFAIVFMLCGNLQTTYRLYQARSVRVEGEKALALEKQNKTLTVEQKEAKEKWMGYQEKRKPENIRKEVAKEKEKIGGQGYFGVFKYFLGINAMIQSIKFYGGGFFDIIGLFFLGMALYKWNIITGQRKKKFYWVMLAICYPIGLALSYYNLSTTVALKFDWTRMLDKTFIDFYEFRRTLVTLGHLSLIILLYKYGVFTTLYRWLARVGQMAFTNYLMQSIICTIIFYGYGFALFGKLQRYQEYYVVGAVWVFQIIFSNIWLHYYRFGPFEWLWRSLTYWKKQPMKKASVVEEPEEETGGEPIPALA